MWLLFISNTDTEEGFWVETKEPHFACAFLAYILELPHGEADGEHQSRDGARSASYHDLVHAVVDTSYLLPRNFNFKRSALGLEQTLQLLCVQVDWLQTGPNGLIPKASHAGKW